MAVRPFVVPLVFALASAALLLVAIENASSKKAELMSMYAIQPAPAQLFDLDPDVLGDHIYSTGAAMARDNLEAGVQAGIAARRAQQQQQIETAIAREEEHAARMQDACEKNPSLPGCPYISQPISWNNVGVDPEDAGDHYYNMIANQAQANLEANREAEKRAVREANYRADVERFEKEYAAYIRMKDACDLTPGLAGCESIDAVEVRPPAYAPEHDNTAYVYQNIADERNNALEADRLASKADIARRNQKVADNMAAAIAAAEARVADFRKACAEDPTHTAGCF
mmetsp:Transcript_28654/g.58590  ORF Transcript_28654/g.58590 Transcript_28654/m.58590 type:complete len:285 (-) Transcript_28654:128-982(-)|eukprot:CAMPEP_0181318158 /NCGR_PEP_ID=MMETSP1101-20121128/16856_1 /TAXON_ID=46948 /ORGANISM="Rhodomonas abbreviata, Strain Caron Lab Isolate" /LENGTH=284 /DNA_ID=CAMNT_0023425607 /DNA_START=30 /DNA_END=884 /DNA_ORIENTATION=-